VMMTRMTWGADHWHPLGVVSPRSLSAATSDEHGVASHRDGLYLTSRAHIACRQHRPKMNATGGRTEIRISSLLIEPYRSPEIMAINPNKETLTRNLVRRRCLRCRYIVGPGSAPPATSASCQPLVEFGSIVGEPRQEE